MKRAFIIFSLALAAVFTFLWAMVLLGELYQVRHPLKFTPAGFPIASSEQPFFRRSYSIELPKHGRIHLLLASDIRGFVFDVFLAQVPPEKAPGPTGSDATQQWLKPSAERMAAAYSRHFGFEKGITDRHGQYLNDPMYFYGTDYYVAVPHLLLILLCLFPTIWLLIHRHSDRSIPPPNNFLEPSAANVMSSATRSTSKVGVGSLHDHYP
jgi:hypothetical protein